jgi:hypothetical protein
LNLRFLGDALDHWKGSLFESLQSARILRNFAVDPMASDLVSWRREDFRIFARLLHVWPTQIVQHVENLQKRSMYFAEISHQGDLFLDPDIGIATGRVKSEHVSPTEIRTFLDSPATRLLVVYQHVCGQKASDRVDAVLTVLQKKIGRCSWASYESSTVAMLFLSRTPERTEEVIDHFRGVLGSHAKGKVRSSR